MSQNVKQRQYYIAPCYQAKLTLEKYHMLLGWSTSTMQSCCQHRPSLFTDQTRHLYPGHIAVLFVHIQDNCCLETRHGFTSEIIIFKFSNLFVTSTSRRNRTWFCSMVRQHHFRKNAWKLEMKVCHWMESCRACCDIVSCCQNTSLDVFDGKNAVKCWFCKRYADEFFVKWKTLRPLKWQFFFLLNK